MTYEDYLQKTCGNMSEYSGCPLTRGVWMGNGVDLTFPYDQYANYLGNWYHNHNPMMVDNIYYVVELIFIFLSFVYCRVDFL